MFSQAYSKCVKTGINYQHKSLFKGWEDAARIKTKQKKKIRKNLIAGISDCIVPFYSFLEHKIL